MCHLLFPVRLCRRHSEERFLNLIKRQFCLSIAKVSTGNSEPRPVQLAYRIHEGDSPNKPVVILHGLLGNGRNWDPIAKQLVRRTQKTVITVDTRNHGDSEHNDDMSFEAMSVDIVSLLTQLNQKSCTVIGHSLGGRIAMTMALSKPEIVDKLIPIDISPVHQRENGDVGEVFRFILAMNDLPMDDSLSLHEARRKADKHLEPVITDGSIRGFILTNLTKQNGKLKWRINLNSIIKHFKLLGRIPEFDDPYNGPTLFIGGTRSDYIQPSHYPEIHRLFPQAKVEMIVDAGHWVHYNKPRELLDLLEQFIKS